MPIIREIQPYPYFPQFFRLEYQADLTLVPVLEYKLGFFYDLPVPLFLQSTG